MIAAWVVDIGKKGANDIQFLMMHIYFEIVIFFNKFTTIHKPIKHIEYFLVAGWPGFIIVEDFMKATKMFWSCLVLKKPALGVFFQYQNPSVLFPQRYTNNLKNSISIRSFWKQVKVLIIDSMV